MIPHAYPATRLNRLISLALLCGGLTFAGCSQVYTVKVDAMRTPEVAPRRTYHLVAADPGRNSTDPMFAEAAAMVDRALEARGYFAASHPEWADMIIKLDYGIGQRRLISAPDPSARDAGVSTIFLPDRSGDTVASTPGTQVPGTAFTRVIAVWEKHLSLVACENSPIARHPDQAGAELWRVDVSVQDRTPSVRELLPVLATALIDSIDRETNPQTIKRISQSEAAAYVVSSVD